ncbi:hypothetical protein F8M49_24665 [Rhodococcus zopfii]|uniref:Uncharacterized protein n=1 Tax=Rhodococcus zopfii TaxID=43772 RepID=A0ABU3WUV1_9NOCA|nr:hypothetical protein [Rhodococcus zopfii]
MTSKSAPRRARSPRRKIGYATLAVSAFVTVSCAGTDSGAAALPEATERYRSPEQIQGATVVWSAEPGLYLQDERGTLVRAAEEAWFVARYVGLENSYPGFAAALDPASARVITPLSDRRPAGTLRAHVLSIASTGTGFEAAVCTRRSELAERWADGRYHFTSEPDIEASIRFARTAPPPGVDEPTAAGALRDTKQTSSQRQWQSPPDRPVHRNRMDHQLRHRSGQHPATVRGMGSQHPDGSDRGRHERHAPRAHCRPTPGGDRTSTAPSPPESAAPRRSRP